MSAAPMRYVLIDRFLELEGGRRAKAVKCVTRGEGFLGAEDTYPPTLVLESILQIGGTVARVVAAPGTRTMLGKVERATFPSLARPGDRVVVEYRPGERAMGLLFAADRLAHSRLIDERLARGET